MEKTMPIAIVAVIISVVAIASTLVMRPATLAPDVTTDELVDGAVTGDKVSDNTITDFDIVQTGISRIAEGAVGSDQVENYAITLNKLDPAAIVALENIADNSITGAKVKDENLTSADIGPDAVGSSEIATDAVGSDEIADNTVGSSDIADGTIAAADLTTEVSDRLGKAASVIVAADGSGDYTDIQSGINALPSGGGAVYIREGTYTVSSSITVPSNVSLIGAGGATKIVLADGGVNIDVITASNAQNILIANLNIDGNKANQIGASDGIYFSNVENSRISGCRIRESNNDGIYLYSSSNNTVTGNTCKSSEYHGIELRSSSNNNTVTGNTCESNGDCGIELVTSSNNNTVTGNTCDSNGEIGIYLSSSANNTVTGNTVESNGYNGIDFRGSSNNNTVTGNTVGSNGRHGIYLDTSSNNNVLTGNVSVNNSQASAKSCDGIYLNGSDYNVITSNRSTGSTQRYGVNISNAGCDKNLVATNVLIGNGTGSLNDAGTGTVDNINIKV